MTPAAGGAPPLPLEPALARALADELVAITTQLSDLAFDLASDADTLRRHMHSLQAVDRITQAQLAVADILRATASTEQRLAGVTLEATAASLRQRVESQRRDMFFVVAGDAAT